MYSNDMTRSAADFCDSSTIEGPFVVDRVELSLIVRAHTSLFFVIGGHPGVIDLEEGEAFQVACMTLYFTLVWVMT